MSDYRIGPGMQVELHFAVKLADGTVVDTTFEGKPATLVVGDGNLLPGFEACVFGLAAGDRESLTLSPEQGFGEINTDNIRTVARHQFSRDMELTQGLVISFAGPDETQLPGVVKQVGSDTVEVDFNHPLAGRDLIFEVQIIDVVPVQPDLIARG